MPSHLTKSFYPAFVVLFFLPFQSYSQTLINTTGSTIANNNYIIEYSIGEIGITTIASTNNDATQGLLQPLRKVQNPECVIVNDIIQYFPNPAQDIIRIVGRHDWIKSYNIYQSDGKLVMQSNYYNNQINVSRLASGVYLVVLYPGCDGNFKTLKILKQ